MARQPEYIDFRTPKQRFDAKMNELWDTDPEAAARIFVQQEQINRAQGCAVIFSLKLVMAILLIGYWATH